MPMPMLFDVAMVQVTAACLSLVAIVPPGCGVMGVIVNAVLFTIGAIFFYFLSLALVVLTG